MEDRVSAVALIICDIQEVDQVYFCGDHDESTENDTSYERLPIFHQDPAARCSRNVLPDAALPVPNVSHTEGASYPNHEVLRRRAEATHDGGLILEKTQSTREGSEGAEERMWRVLEE